MKGRPVDQLVYEYIFPKPRASDPQNFHTLLHRHLIPEVRQEVHSFYGHLDTQEAKYPGLDYTHRIHRIRLSRWQWHRRLFRAFDGLRLTDSEIANLTKWEGTKWAKERFEADSGSPIRDTAFDGIPYWNERNSGSRRARATQTDNAQQGSATAGNETGAEEREEGEEEEDSDGELTSVGMALNERLRERAARQGDGDSSPLDEDWEQWLKNVVESGRFPYLTGGSSREDQIDLSQLPQALFPPGMLSAGRAGRWHEIPNYLREVLRLTLELENDESTRAGSSSATGEHPSGNTTRSPRRDHPDLRLPANETGVPAASRIGPQQTAQSGTQTYISLP